MTSTFYLGPYLTHDTSTAFMPQRSHLRCILLSEQSDCAAIGVPLFSPLGLYNFRKDKKCPHRPKWNHSVIHSVIHLTTQLCQEKTGRDKKDTEEGENPDMPFAPPSFRKTPTPLLKISKPCCESVTIETFTNVAELRLPCIQIYDLPRAPSENYQWLSQSPLQPLPKQ